MKRRDVVSRINSLLVLFGAVVAASFGFGGYLMVLKPSIATTGPAKSAQASEAEQVQSAGNLLAKKQTEQALLLYRRTLAGNPRSATAQLGIARAELVAGRESVSAEEFERVLRLDPQNDAARLSLAGIYSHERRTWPLAERRFRELVSRNPNDLDSQLGLARVLAWQGKAKEAADIFARDAVSSRMSRQDRRDYAFALMRSGKLDAAETVLKQLTAGGTADYDLRLQLASLHTKRGNWTAALPLYRVLLNERPNDPNVNLALGLGLLTAKDYRAATGPLAKARALMPGSGEAGLGYARALKGVNDVKRAANEFAQVLPHYRQNPQILREYADLQFEKGDARQAAKYYQEAHRLGLRDTRLLVGISGALIKSRKPREALPFMEEAYRQQPTERLAFELAKLLHLAGHDNEAVALLDRMRPATKGRDLKPGPERASRL